MTTRTATATAWWAASLVCCLLGLVACGTTLPSAAAPVTTDGLPQVPAAAPPAEVAPAVDPLLAEARAVVAGMTLEAQVGQLVVAGTPATGLSASTADLVASGRAGGVILTGRSTVGVEGTAQVTAAVQQAALDGGNLPALVSADQEGGRVQVLQGPGFPDMPPATEQGTWSADRLTEATSGWGAALRAAGVHVVLGPVVDVVPAGTEADNPPIGAFGRQYGSDPATVSAAATAASAGWAAAGVGTVVKHFPGLGRVAGNTDTTAGVVDDVTTRDDPCLEPFRAAIAAGAPAVMMSTAVYTQLDPSGPAAFSPAVVDGLLRTDLGFGGVVVSDDLARAAQVADVPVADRGTAFVRAGGDLVLVVLPDVAAQVYDGLLAAARADPALAARVVESAERVVRWKFAQGLR